MIAPPPPPLPDLTPLEGLPRLRFEQPAGTDEAWGDTATAVGNLGAPLRLIARRVGGKVRISQVGGGELRRPRLRGDFETGLTRFVRFDVKTLAGERLHRSYSSFCPNGAGERIDELDPAIEPRSTFPGDCGGTLTRRTVWGLDRGWATSASPDEAITVPPGRYILTVTVDPAKQLADARRSNNSIDVPLRVVSVPAPPEPEPGPDPVIGGGPEGGVAGAARDVLLPDLRVLPASGATLTPAGDRLELSFTSTVWNAGPGPIWLEGRRGEGAKRMETEQVLPRPKGPPLRRAVNDFVFDLRDGHAHWHYNGLARYRLVRENGSLVATDAKQGFCFLPTDAIDLGLPGAVLVPPTDVFAGGFCGRAYSTAVRMRLDAGWGDTYGSGLPGQAIDVSGVPDGTYFIEVLANANGRLRERSTSNNLSRRRIVLATGEDGRTVREGR